VINLAAGGGGGGSAPAAPATTVATTEEHLVQLRAGNRSASISCKGAKEMVISSAYGDLKINQCVFWGGYGKAGDDNWKGEFAPSGGKVTDHYPWVLKVPDGALSCSLWWELADDNHEASLQVIF
jgi:hypothetical protein